MHIFFFCSPVACSLFACLSTVFSCSSSSSHPISMANSFLFSLFPTLWINIIHLFVVFFLLLSFNSIQCALMLSLLICSTRLGFNAHVCSFLYMISACFRTYIFPISAKTVKPLLIMGIHVITYVCVKRYAKNFSRKHFLQLFSSLYDILYGYKHEKSIPLTFYYNYFK